MKNLTPVLIAFFLGMVLCFTIQACADDKEERTPSGTNGTNTTKSDSYGWDTEKFSSEIWYTESGQMDLKNEYTYDSKGRLIEQKTTEYLNGVAVSTNFYKYTYNGNTRTKITDEGRKCVQTVYTE